jgi:hypothetical protein
MVKGSDITSKIASAEQWYGFFTLVQENSVAYFVALESKLL